MLNGRQALLLLNSVCCLGFRVPDSISEVGEPYEEEGDYITAEEYEQLVGGHAGRVRV